jgi:hypothetical protein
LPIWATLAAYGRRGYRALVERHCALAQQLAATVDAALDLQRLAEVPLNVVCFRYRPAGRSEADLDAINRRLGEALLDDGRVFAGTTVYSGHVALRPAISNWRTTAADLDLFVDVVRELGAPLMSGAGRRGRDGQIRAPPTLPQSLWTIAFPRPCPVAGVSTRSLLATRVAAAALATLSRPGEYIASSSTDPVWGLPTANTVAAVPLELNEVEM